MKTLLRCVGKGTPGSDHSSPQVCGCIQAGRRVFGDRVSSGTLLKGRSERRGRALGTCEVGRHWFGAVGDTT